MSSLLTEDSGVQLNHGIVCDCSIKVSAKDAAKDMKLLTSLCSPINHRGVGHAFKSGEGTTLGALDKAWWQQYVLEGCVRFVATVTNICG